MRISRRAATDPSPERANCRVTVRRVGRSGIHVVTGERARNVRFYEKNEFRPLATTHWNGADVVFSWAACFGHTDAVGK